MNLDQDYAFEVLSKDDEKNHWFTLQVSYRTHKPDSLIEMKPEDTAKRTHSNGLKSLNSIQSIHKSQSKTSAWTTSRPAAHPKLVPSPEKVVHQKMLWSLEDIWTESQWRIYSSKEEMEHLREWPMPNIKIT